MKTELLLINFHNNDFYFPMRKTAKFLLEESNEEKNIARIVEGVRDDYFDE